MPRIERLVRRLCRQRPNESEAEELVAHVTLKLVENNYAVLRAFRERSSIDSYLATVVARILNDYRNHAWGKWHASAAAVRLGPLALEMERRLYRDHQPIDEAFADVRAKFPDVGEYELRTIVDQLPRRMRHQLVSIDAAMQVAGDADVDVLEWTDEARRVSKLIRAYIDRLAEDDRLILRLRFSGGLTAAEIARMVHRKPFQIYEGVERHLQQLRVELEAAGIQAAAIEAFIGNDNISLDFLETDDRPEERHVP